VVVPSSLVIARDHGLSSYPSVLPSRANMKVLFFPRDGLLGLLGTRAGNKDLTKQGEKVQAPTWI
jgi:hypothetical protein